MAAPTPDMGTGTVLTWSSWEAEIVEMTGPGAARAAIDVTHLLSSGGREYEPSDLADNGDLTLTVHHAATAAPPVTGNAASATIAWGGVSGTTWTFSAFMTNYEPTATAGDKMTASVTLKVNGAITIDSTV